MHPVESIGGLAATDMCPCPNNVTYCQQLPTVTKLEGGLQRLHSADDVVTECLKTYGSYMHSTTTTTSYTKFATRAMGDDSSHQLVIHSCCDENDATRRAASRERLPPTSQTTVAFCLTLAVAHCAPTPMTCGSCSCREHITKSVIGVSRPPVLDCGTTFHPDSGDRDFFDPFRQSMKTHLFGDRSA